MTEIHITGVSLTEPYSWGDRCLGWKLADTGGLSVKSERMPPGTREQLHYHAEAQQYFYILSGEAVFYIEEKIYIVPSGQGIHIPHGLRHYIQNDENSDLEFLVISQPNTINDRIICEPGS